ncbi:MAG: radical SAM protein [Theionarchaea archaeon]|nr:radical SAM protein [Theionarchaea archaeon]
MDEFLVMQLGITNRCNLGCIHCYEELQTPRDMTSQHYTTIVSKFLETADIWGKRAVVWLTGGEPLVHPDLWNFVGFLQEQKDSGSHLSAFILTNGVLMDERCVSYLEKYPVVTDVQVSLDGTSESVHEAIRGKGTYKKTVDAIKLLSASKLKVHIHMVVSKENLVEAYTLPEVGLTLGVDVLTVTRLVPFGRGKAMRERMISPEEMRSLYLMLSEKRDEFEKNGVNLLIARNRCDWPVVFYRSDLPQEQLAKNGGHCMIGNNHFAVLEDGTVLPCRRLPVPIGNILHQDLREIFDHPLLWQFRRKHTLMKGKCRLCVFSNHLWKYCSGGASCISYGYYEDSFMPDPQCPYLMGKEAGH